MRHVRRFLTGAIPVGAITSVIILHPVGVAYALLGLVCACFCYGIGLAIDEGFSE